MSDEITCSGCDSCQICDGCEVDCEYCESFCEQGRQTASNSFNFNGACLATGQQLFSLKTWNAAIEQINSIYSRGSEKNASGLKLPSFSGNWMTAAAFNRVAQEVGYSTVNAGDEMKGTYFSELAGKIRTMKYKSYQCNECNASCDGGCNECMSCDAGCLGETITCCHCDDTKE